MDAPQGKVIAVNEDSATVAVEGAVACARCAAGRGCGAGLLQKGRTRLVEVKVAEGLMLAVDDLVRLELAPAHLLKAAWLAYGLPLTAMVVAVAVGARLAREAGDATIVLIAVAGLVSGLVLGRRALARNGCLQHMVPTAVQRMNAAPAQGASGRGQR